MNNLHGCFKYFIGTAFFLFLPLTFASSLRTSFDKAQLSSFAFSKEWLSLLHYEKNTFQGYTGNVDSEKFYFSPEGKYDPLSELEAFVKAYDENPKKVSCDFPARSLVVNSLLPKPFVISECPVLQEWVENLAPESVSYVFASYFSSAPASYFGHTFLLLDRDPEKDFYNKNFSWGISYSALVENDPNPIIYGIKGFGGLYLGFYSIEQFHQKLKTYAEIDNRDLWEYKINLSPQEIELLVLHFWELGHKAAAKYFFADENCSYQMIWAIQAVKPHLPLMESLPTVVVPIDTIEVLKKFNLVDEPKLYLSRENKLLQKYQSLSEDKLSAHKKLIRGDIKSKEVADTETLDFSIDYLRYQKNTLKKDFPPQQEELFNKLLMQRARLEVTRPFDYKKEKPPPEDKHGRAKVSLSLRNRSGERTNPYPENTFLLEYYPLLHDIRESSFGFPFYSHTKMMLFEALVTESRGEAEIKLNRASIIDLKAYSPYNPISKNLAFTAELSYRRLKDSLPQLHFNFGLGLAKSFFGDSLLLSFIPYLEEAWNIKDQQENFNHGLGIANSFRLALNDRFTFYGEFIWQKIYGPEDPFDRKSYEANINFFWNKSFSQDFGIKGIRDNEHWEQIFTKLNYYF